MNRKIILFILFFAVNLFISAQNASISSSALFLKKTNTPDILPSALQAQNNTFLWRLDSIGRCDETFGNSHYYYDNSHRLIKEYYSNGMQKNEFFYDASDRLTMMLNSYYDEFLLNNWNPVQIWQYAYNENDIPISYEVSSWTYDNTFTTLQWVKQFREDVLLDSNGLAIERNAYYWMNDLSYWYNHTKTVFHYSPQLREDVVYMWDSIISDWKPINKSQLYTDIAGKDSLFIGYNFDGTGWLANSKYELIYDANGNNTQMVISNYINNLWHEYQMRGYYYEYAYTDDDIIVPFNFLPQSNNMLTHIIFHAKDSNDWVMHHCDTLYYNGFSQGLPHVAATAPKVFPNPFSDFFHIEGKGKYTFELYDLHGRLLRSYESEGLRKICTVRLSKGIYFYRHFQEGYVFSGKMIKQ